jgi:pimeloyl-[acyl-carrier protein] methyl ester esterase
VANEAWPQAMPVEQYTQFKSSILADPKRGMQCFCTLVTLAGAAARERTKLLHQQLNSIDLNYQVKHLLSIAAIKSSGYLKNHSVKMLFIFSENDMLVPYKVSQESVFLTTQNLNLVKYRARTMPSF